MYSMFEYQMPSVDTSKLHDLTYDEQFILNSITSTKGKNRGSIRASKPPVVKNDLRTGYAAYVWRMVVFMVSPIGQHQCMPVTADWDVRLPNESEMSLHDKYEARAKKCKELDVLVDKFLNTIPKEKWYGVIRWGHALGHLG